MNNREVAEHIFLAGIRGVLPGKIINDLFSLRGSLLKIGYLSFDLEKIKNVYVIGAGKASASMAHFVENILGDRITEGHIVTKYGYFCKLRKITVTEAGHPVPDENSFRATEEIIQIAEKAAENDLVICLWSGGGSTLLADYPESSSPQEVMFFNEMLIRCGAEIREMNIIRKHLSKVKGGQLLKHIWPAASVSIFLSDVIGDHLDIIASGPTVPDNSTFADALKVIEKYQLKNDIPAKLLNYLEEGAGGKRPETPKQNDDIFLKSAKILAANNKTALQSAKAEAENLEFTTFIISNELAGDTDRACSYIIDSIYKLKNDSGLHKPVCLLFGGEITVKVTGNGTGGRNQHLALTAALKIQDIPGITLLSGGTDGNDGSTEMAGAVVDSETVHDALTMNADPESYLKDFDSYHFFDSVGGAIFTGPTMTNVMDIVVVIIE